MKMNQDKEEDKSWSTETMDGSDGAGERGWESDEGEEEWGSEDDEEEVLPKVRMG